MWKSQIVIRQHLICPFPTRCPTITLTFTSGVTYLLPVWRTRDCNRTTSLFRLSDSSSLRSCSNGDLLHALYTQITHILIIHVFHIQHSNIQNSPPPPQKKKSHTKDSLIKFKINNIKIINEKINSNFDIKQNKGY